MKLILEIEMDNDAFYRNRRYEVARILQEFTKKLERDGLKPGYEWSLYDLNGNRTGTAEVVGDDE